jgi:hypothetical protein
MEQLIEWIPFLIPIVLIQLALMIFALIDLIRRERTKGPKWMWVLIVVFINIFGPVVYLLVGREE